MFEVPGSDIKNVHITEACVKGRSPPEFVYIDNSIIMKAVDSVPSSDVEKEHSTEACIKSRSESVTDEVCKLADSVKAFISYF